MVEAVGTNLISQVINNREAWVRPDSLELVAKAKMQSQDQKEVASTQASKALKAYVSPIINKAMPATSLQYINQLKNAGKIEGKDFEVKKDEEYIDVTEFDTQGKILKGSAWQIVDGNEKPLGTDNFAYRPDGKVLYRDSKDINGKLEMHSHHYYNNEINQNTISHDGLTFETKVEDYIKNLQAKGIKYTEQIENSDNGKSKYHIVEEYTPDGKQTLKTVWVDVPQKPEHNHVYRDLFNADGSVSTSVLFDNEKSIVVNFFKQREE